MIVKYVDELNLINAELTQNKEIVEKGNEERIEGVPTILEDGLNNLILNVLIKNPKTILELGTAKGISGSSMLTFCKNATLTTIEKNENMRNEAIENFKYFNVFDRVESFLGDSLEVSKNLCESGRKFDFIFLDCNKAGYFHLYPYLKKMLNVGGVLFADNVLFRGYVSKNFECPKVYRTLIQKIDNYNRLVANDKDMLTSFSSVGDGVAVSYKLRESK